MTDYIPCSDTETEQWVAWKNQKIGGHAVCTLMGVNPYQTLPELFDQIRNGVREDITPEKKRFFKWRSMQEKLIAEIYAEETGRTLRRVRSSLHPDDDRLTCSPDREILKDPRGVGHLEIKSANPMVFASMKLKGAPESFWVQNQHYMMCGGRAWGGIAVGNVDNGEQIRVEFDADYEFHKILWDRIQSFLTMVERNVRPTVDLAEPVRLPAVGGELVRVESMDDRMVRAFKEGVGHLTLAKSLKAEASAIEDAAKAALQNWMLDSGSDVVEGFGNRIYYKEQAGRKTLDKKALQAKHPEIKLDEFMKPGKPFRSFRHYQIKGENNE